MEHFDINALITSHIRLSSDIFLLKVHAPYIAFAAKPGQFCMIRVSREGNDPLLRRPFSIHKVSQEGGFVSFLYKVVGKGTLLLSQYRAGEKLNIFGPLGNHFSIKPGERAMIIGGGIGVAPLVFLAEKMAFRSGISVFLGFKNRDDVCCIDEFNRLSSQVFVSTEDGSYGFNGVVIDILKNEFLESKEIPRYFYSCGPYGMQRALFNMLKDEILLKKISLEVSLEARMACGIGICMGCVVESTGNGYYHVCKDGPVFNAKKILWK